MNNLMGLSLVIMLAALCVRLDDISHSIQELKNNSVCIHA